LHFLACEAALSRIRTEDSEDKIRDEGQEGNRLAKKGKGLTLLAVSCHPAFVAVVFGCVWREGDLGWCICCVSGAGHFVSLFIDGKSGLRWRGQRDERDEIGLLLRC
jgi:hypothetical protein